ncbi:MAG TPA: nuclear transport factor 2 family protein [Ktedonobacteraceae bacterium]|nr:nuclear transport factor 2 family protein [Ktedonobacteraceae bacterium]
MQINDEIRSLLRPPVSQWIEAFNAHNVGALVALYTDDAVLFDAGMKAARRGKNEIERWFTTRFRTMPSIRYVPNGQVFTEDGQAAVTWTTHGRGPRLLGQSWLARPFQVDGVSIFTLREGLICQQRGYYDHLAVVEQILPPLKWLLPSRL